MLLKLEVMGMGNMLFDGVAAAGQRQSKSAKRLQCSACSGPPQRLCMRNKRNIPHQ
jgi:hypothetical protein